MKITEAYTTCQINAGLQEHMIRVAAVAQLICDHSSLPIDKTVAVSACLLHDLGNLIKINFEYDSGHFEPEGIVYWKEVKAKMIEQYGDVDTATYEMTRSLKPLPAIVATVEAAAFTRMKEIAVSDTLEAKVLEYADMRVGLYGILSMADRFQDIRQRYVPKVHSAAYINELEAAAAQIEQELFASADITPADITDESTADIQSALWNWNISTQAD